MLRVVCWKRGCTHAEHLSWGLSVKTRCIWIETAQREHHDSNAHVSHYIIRTVSIKSPAQCTNALSDKWSAPAFFPTFLVRRVLSLKESSTTGNTSLKRREPYHVPGTWHSNSQSRNWNWLNRLPESISIGSYISEHSTEYVLLVAMRITKKW